MRLKRILVPTDFSKDSALALKGAIMIAEATKDSTIFLLHVLPPAVDSVYSVEENLVELRWDQAKKELAGWKRKVPRKIPCVTLFRKGRAALVISRVCQEESINLIVMTTHGRQGLSRIVHPNASEETVRLAPCPVLILPINRSNLKLKNAGKN